MNKAQRDDNQRNADGRQSAKQRLAPRDGRRRSGALLLCIVELNERRVGLLGLGVLRLIGHSPHLPTLGEYEHGDDGKTDHAGRHANNGERVEARLLCRSSSGLLSSGRSRRARIGLVILLAGLIGILLGILIVLGLGRGGRGDRLLTRSNGTARLLTVRAVAGVTAIAIGAAIAARTAVVVSTSFLLSAAVAISVVESILFPILVLKIIIPAFTRIDAIRTIMDSRENSTATG